MWSVHQYCAKGCSPLLWWIKVIITLLRQLLPHSSMGPVSSNFSTPPRTIRETNVIKSDLNRRKSSRFQGFQMLLSISHLRRSKLRTPFHQTLQCQSQPQMCSGHNLHLNPQWLEKVSATEEIDGVVNLTWLAHHASSNRSPEFEVSITPLLPLLRDQAHSVTTIKHVMQKVQDAVAYLNPGQVPVITADQSIYAIAKQVQWQWLD